MSLNPCCNGIYSMSSATVLRKNIYWNVLILVVMEYTQWVALVKASTLFNNVLILVVMEYTQWAQKVMLRNSSPSLNPCCNGIYSMSIGWNSQKKSYTCLNPCCNGIYSMRRVMYSKYLVKYVLILVVMEYTQWARSVSVQVALFVS